ncbi:MAG: prepilin-type N-terminal cleavage/methylation domain-containing protein [Isosphaeraceae bacterium]|nr:prepilin-type N-terminal cleavage/methylation domain-containing protein [Isosphaeraceae bacterium]
MRGAKRRARPGFTLIELSIVLLIIGLILAFILAASSQAAARAQQRATQGLISKLESGLLERIEAIMSVPITPNGAHQYLAAAFPVPNTLSGAALPWGLPSDQRAYVIARFDQMKRELPDVFFVDPAFTSGSNTNYPLNFTGLPYPPGNTSDGLYAYVLPLGNTVGRPGSAYQPYYAPTSAPSSPPWTPAFTGPGGYWGPGGYSDPRLNPGSNLPYNPNQSPMGEGIFGASYAAAGGIYKNLGYQPTGYDGTDNNGNGLVDEWAEGIGNDPDVEDPDNPGINNTIKLSQLIRRRLGNHRHKTARSEMLYALLVEGRGPLGSVFSRDDFTDREVRDTDNDGLPEFVDAWGEPLQFFRWPIYYISNIQKGYRLYDSILETREQNPLDPNNTLIAPAWWSNLTNPPNMSAKAQMFQQYFTSISEDPSLYASAAQGTAWDRSGSYARRAWFSKFLILSAGPDIETGLPNVLTDSTIQTQSADTTSAYLISTEGRAQPPLPGTPGADAADDNISNQTLPTAGGGFQ